MRAEKQVHPELLLTTMELASFTFSEATLRMQLKTILNRVERHKSFVYGEPRWAKDASRPTIEVPIEPRANSRPICSGCGRPGPGFDRRPARKFEFVPLWRIAVFFVYAMRRVDCPRCGVTVEQVPWAEGKHRLTRSYQWFLAGWAKRLSWSETAAAFHTSWDHVRNAVDHAVRWGLAHRELKGIGGHRRGRGSMEAGAAISDVGLPDRRRRQAVAVDRQGTDRGEFPRVLQVAGNRGSQGLKYVCSDMWKPYLNVIAAEAPGAIHMLDRFHIMAKMNKAIDEVRRAEAKRLEAAGYEPVLKHSRWCLLKRPENRTTRQTVKLRELLQYNLQSVRAHLQREDFQRFWEYASPSLGRQVPRRMDDSRDALEDRADEEDGQDASLAPGTDSQLVRGAGSDLFGRRRNSLSPSSPFFFFPPFPSLSLCL